MLTATEFVSGLSAAIMAMIWWDIRSIRINTEAKISKCYTWAEGRIGEVDHKVDEVAKDCSYLKGKLNGS